MLWGGPRLVHTSSGLTPMLVLYKQPWLVCGQSGSSRGSFSSGSHTFLGFSCCCNWGDTRADSLANQGGPADVTCPAGSEEGGRQTWEAGVSRDRPGEWWALTTQVACLQKGGLGNLGLDSNRDCVALEEVSVASCVLQTYILIRPSSNVPYKFCSAIFMG